MSEEETRLSVVMNEVEHKVTEEQLPKIMSGLTRISSATVSVSRKMTTFKYESEDFFGSITIDFSDMWSALGKQVDDPDKLPALNDAFHDVFLDKTRRARILLYREILCACLDRARQLGLSTSHKILAEEFSAFGTSGGFDPHDTLGYKRGKGEE